MIGDHSTNPIEIRHVVHTTCSTAAMALGVISNEGHVIPFHFFQQGFQVYVTAYIEVLEQLLNSGLIVYAGTRNAYFSKVLFLRTKP